jgi:glycosyltransferase involved in cell wall biosynthesis
VRDNTIDNIGFGRAANELAARGTDPLILFVNPDGDPEPGCFDALERCFSDDEVVAAEAAEGWTYWVNRWDPERYTWLSGACLAVRRDAFLRVGGFDSSLFMYWEDVDLSWRLARLGKLVHCSEVVFNHDRGPRPFRLTVYFIRNGIIVRRRWRRGGSLVREARSAAHALSRGDIRLAAAYGAGSLAYLAHRPTGHRSVSGHESGAAVPDFPTRVLHLTDVVNRFDYVDNVVRHLNRAAFETEVCTFTRGAQIAPPEYDRAAIYHRVLNVSSRRDYPFAAIRLANFLRGRAIDILHAHNYNSNLLAWLALHMHRSTRLVVGRHYTDTVDLPSSGMNRRAVLGFDAQVNNYATRIVVPSVTIRDLLVTRRRVAEEKVTVIPHPFDPSQYPIFSHEERAAQRAELGITSRFALVTVGQLSPDKGHRYMIEAVHHLRRAIPDLTLLIVGDGPERPTIEEAIRDDLHDAVRLLGWRADVWKIIGAVDAMVQRSIQGGYSRVMREALWLGTPLVVTDVSGARDFIIDGDTGVLAGTTDVSALADAVRMLYRDAQLRNQVGVRGRHFVEEHLSLAAVIPRLEQLYVEILSGGER